MKKIIVTGGAGFIGSNLTIELIKRGYQVKVIDNLSGGLLKNLDPVKDEIEFVKGDIRSLDLLEKQFTGYDAVLHQAALGSVPRSIKDPYNTHTSNTTGTLNVLIAAKNQDIKKVVFASSSSVYGNRENSASQKVVKKKEIMEPQPLSPYAVSKISAEYYVKVFSHIYDLPTITLRYFNVFGPRQNPNSEYAAVIPLFIKAILKGEQPQIFGDGTQSRDFTYVRNNIEANILAMNSKVKNGEIINIACSQSISLLQLINLINSILNTKISPKLNPPRIGDVKNSLADISKAKKLINYSPIVDVEEGLKKTINWYKKIFKDKKTNRI
ncbi:MAG: SDR family oxidoreductase [Candidatus Kerfeldbacteria bacterium]